MPGRMTKVDGVVQPIIRNGYVTSSMLVDETLAVGKMADGVAAKVLETAQAITVDPDDTFTTAAVSIAPATSGYDRLVIQAIDIVFGGTFDSETATVGIIATYDDDTTSSELTRTATSTSTVALTTANILALNVTGKSIKSLAIRAKSDHATSTSVTVTINGLFQEQP